MEAEVYFLRYAFPCSFLLMQRREIDKDEYNELREAAIKRVVLPREKLEKIYFRAFERIDRLADELNKDRWDIEVIKEYFLKRHNELIDQGMYDYKKAPDSLKELCKIKKAKVIDARNGFLIVKFDGKKRSVLKDLVPNIKVGDIVNIHYGYVVEKLQF